MNKKDTSKPFYIIIAVVSLILIGYIVTGVYDNYTGSIRTEFTFSTTASDIVKVKGVVFRDEYKKKNSQNSAIIKGSAGDIYSPVVSDGESIGKNEPIAYVFSSQDQLDAYKESLDIKSDIETLTKLQDSKNMEYLDVDLLNLEISNALRDYIKLCDLNELGDISAMTDTLNYKMTSKQIITTQQINFSSEIKSLQTQYNQLQKQIKNKKVVTSPFAGYFVSKIDGYEQLCKYSDVTENKITPSAVNKILNKDVKITDNAYGKIVSQHTWYFVFNMSFAQSSKIKVRSEVYVDFPEKGITDIPMTVASMTRDGDNVALVLKCRTMNSELLSLRIEEAEVKIGSYKGCKISNEALVSQNAVMGVYIYSGNCAIFKPIDIIYHGDDYVIANALLIDEEKTNGGAQDDLHTLKPYDKVILKGRNLYDGKVIG